MLTPVIGLEAPAYAGSNFKSLSRVTSVIDINNSKVMERIIEQIKIARAKSAKPLSKDEIEKLILQAQETVARQAAMADIERPTPGASVFTGSQVIK